MNSAATIPSSGSHLPSGMRAMLFAAGLGSRLKPWTDHHPKALALINGKTLLERNIGYLQQHGIREVIVNVHHFAEQIRNLVEKNHGWGSAITLSDESDEVLETGGGLKKAAWYFEGQRDFAVMNADILTDLDLSAMIAMHRAQQDLATLAVSDRKTSRYFLFDEKGTLTGWKNSSTGEVKIVRETTHTEQKAFSGIHVISTKMLPMIRLQGKFSMVDVYLDLARGHTIRAFDHTGAKLVDVGKPESIRTAENLFL